MDLIKLSFNSVDYNYCTSYEDLSYNAITYKASSITRNEISTELLESDVKISTPLTMEPVNYFVFSSPSLPLTLELTDYSTGITLFTGVLTKISFDRTKELAILDFKRSEAFYDSEVPYRTYGSSCTFGLYGSDCTVSKAAHSITVSSYTVSSDKKSLTSPSFVTAEGGAFTNGHLVISGKESAFISSHVGDTIYLDQPLVNVSGILILSKGCNKTMEQCISRFNNLINFGGFPFIPAKNPVTESI